MRAAEGERPVWVDKPARAPEVAAAAARARAEALEPVGPREMRESEATRLAAVVTAPAAARPARAVAMPGAAAPAATRPAQAAAPPGAAARAATLGARAAAPPGAAARAA